MKKLIVALIIGFVLLFGSFSYANYNVEKLVQYIQKEGKIVEINPGEFVAYLEFHNANREKDHISYYTSVHLLKIENQIVIESIYFIKEDWKLDDDTWTVDRYVAINSLLDGSISKKDCTKLVEKIDGLVIDMINKECPVDIDNLVKDIIVKTAPKRGI